MRLRIVLPKVNPEAIEVPTPSSPETRQIETVVRHIFPSISFMVERVAEGVSTFVYRILCGDETFYLRVLPEAGASFAPEVTAHTLLRQRQVNVPEVIYFEQRIRFTSLLINVRSLARSLQKRPANRYTRHQLEVMREDLAFLLGSFEAGSSEK